MLRILGRPTSINVRKALVTLDEIGCPYQHEPQWATDAAPASSAAFTKLNPNTLVPVLVPVLVDDAFVMWESNAICRYLADTFAREDLFPRAPQERARVDMWLDWQATEFNNSWRDAFLGLVRKHPDFCKPDLIAAGARKWNAAIAILDRRLAETGAYVCGDAFTLADIAIGLGAHRWRSTPIEQAPAPAVADWLARLDQRPAFSRYAAPNYP